MGKITDGTHFDHPCTAFEGMQVAQQVFDFKVVLRVGLPAQQSRPRAFQNIHCLFKKNRHHLGISIAALLSAQLRRGRTQLRDNKPAVAANQPSGVRCQAFMQQVMQGLNQGWLRLDFLTSRQLIEHVDQGFMRRVGLMKETLADRKAAFFNRAIHVEQGFTQRIDGLQVQQVRRFCQAGQLIQQRVQPLPLMGMITPMQQQVFGVEQNVHALAQEFGDALGITRCHNVARRPVEQVRQTSVNQMFGAVGQRTRALDLGQRVAVQLLEAAMKQTGSFAQAFDFTALQLKMVRLVFTHQIIQRRSQPCDGQHTRHRRAAFEGVHGQL